MIEKHFVCNMYRGSLNNCASCGEQNTKFAKVNDCNKLPYPTSCDMHCNHHPTFNTAPATGLCSD